ncbi:MAG: hypothetical protein V1738_04340 [Patescibacteria group bacterium]
MNIGSAIVIVGIWVATAAISIFGNFGEVTAQAAIVAAAALSALMIFRR